VVFVEKSEVEDNLDARIECVVGFVPHLIEKFVGPFRSAHNSLLLG
jgi:hypothetical protein